WNGSMARMPLSVSCRVRRGKSRMPASIVTFARQALPRNSQDLLNGIGIFLANSGHIPGCRASRHCQPLIPASDKNVTFFKCISKANIAVHKASGAYPGSTRRGFMRFKTVAAAAAVLCLGFTAVTAQETPIAKRQALMKGIGGAAAALGGIAK